MQTLLSHLLHIDDYLNTLVMLYGFWTYIVLFAVIFCETGLVILPFLPGDSLLFAAGSLAAKNQHLEFFLLFIILITASIAGNKLNYLIGRYCGPKIFQSNAMLARLFQERHLEATKTFYSHHGGQAIILARFLPIFRTFVPFVAGISGMSMSMFTFYNIISGILWIGSLLTAGYFFGTIPFVQAHFSLVIIGILVITLLPAIFAYVIQKLSPSHS